VIMAAAVSVFSAFRGARKKDRIRFGWKLRIRSFSLFQA
jgi:hypothetical protein